MTDPASPSHSAPAAGAATLEHWARAEADAADGLFRFGASPPADAGARLGAKAARIARLAANGAPTPLGVAVETEAAAALRARLGDLGGRAAVRETARRVQAALAAATAPTAALRLSPCDALPKLLAPANRAEPGALSAPIADLEALADALEAALRAWDGPRAVRRRRALEADPGCAVVVQEAVEGERRLDVALHDPESGAPVALGAVSAAVAAAVEAAEGALAEPLTCDLVERADGAVFLLAARPLKASAAALIAIATRLEARGRIARDDALMVLEAGRLEELLHPAIAAEEAAIAETRMVASGLAASPGAAAGRLCLSPEEAEAAARAGEPVVLAQAETSPEDVYAIAAASGVLTLRGGLSSHAAVVARGLGLPCVVGASEARIDLEGGRLHGPGGQAARGEWVTLDAKGGRLLSGKFATRRPEPTGDLATLMGWADARRRLAVRANADTPQDAETALRLGAEGVGLCRTEHMFFQPGRLTAMREVILAAAEVDRRAALDRLLPMQRADFVRLFEIMGAAPSGPGARLGGEAEPAPVTIRLLDPPLHEFLPHSEADLAALAEAMGQPAETLAKRARDLKEVNPMLGKRGCRLGVAYPEIYEMQARAIVEAALDAEAALGRRVRPEIMIPLISAVRELEMLSARIAAVAEAVFAERGARLSYGVGIMVETPRAALRAEPLGQLATFFSFGTNDLTQMTYGLSRDDASRLMRDYVERGVFEADPFQSLDEDGVGELIRIAVARGRAANPALDIGLCGEHGGAPGAIDFCERVGFDYISCSPFRAPVARLAAAQAAIRQDRRSAMAEGAP